MYTHSSTSIAETSSYSIHDCDELNRKLAAKLITSTRELLQFNCALTTRWYRVGGAGLGGGLEQMSVFLCSICILILAHQCAVYCIVAIGWSPSVIVL